MRKKMKILGALICAVAQMLAVSSCSFQSAVDTGVSSNANVSETNISVESTREESITEETSAEETSFEDTSTEETSGGTASGPVISGKYVYFGNYPQREVVSRAEDSGVHGKVWETENDYIIDATLYNSLKSLSEDKWSACGDTEIDGNKYRRIREADATMSSSGDVNFYDYKSSGTYHYFKYEPIKWRILENNGSDYFLLSEIALDDQKYNSIITNLTWETSTVRSWLNGYGSSANLYGTDYTSCNFIDTAFSLDEKAKIKVTNVVNKDNNNSGTEGGNDTADRIFLLSEDEIYGSIATGYGFATDYNSHDTARQALSSTYAKAMGAYSDCESDSLGCCWWWLRSPGSYTGLYTLVRCNGSVYRGGQHANSKSRAVRPALHVEF